MGNIGGWCVRFVVQNEQENSLTWFPQTDGIWVPAPTSRKHFHHLRSPPPSSSSNHPPCYECQHLRAVLPVLELLINGIIKCMLFGSILSHSTLSLWGSSTQLCVVCVYLLLYISLFCEYSIYLSRLQLMGIWVIYNFWLFWAMLLEHSCTWLLVNIFIHFCQIYILGWNCWVTEWPNQPYWKLPDGFLKRLLPLTLYESSSGSHPL